LNEDAYFKDFIHVIESSSEVAEELGTIKLCYVRDSSKCNRPKIQGSGYKFCQILGMAPQEKENDGSFRKVWAEKIIHYLNNEIKWKYKNIFNFKADNTRTLENKVCSSLDKCLLDKDIGGFVGTYLFDDIQKVKESTKVMMALFGNEENLEIGENILLANWNNWSLED
jgi:signal recognition particle GTPase